METRKLGDDDLWTNPIKYCPICGSADLIMSAGVDNLFDGKQRADVTCDVCDWSCVIIIYEDGKKEFPIRQDFEMLP